MVWYWRAERDWENTSDGYQLGRIIYAKTPKKIAKIYNTVLSGLKNELFVPVSSSINIFR